MYDSLLEFSNQNLIKIKDKNYNMHNDDNVTDECILVDTIIFVSWT